jgi:aspartyl aminopeptidase
LLDVQVIADELGVAPGDIRDLELSLCDTQPARVWGIGNEFLSSPRLDNQVNFHLL